ncbi:hypothetical protein EV715DRAFT_292052 [Schizophyllum commune]
MAPDRKQRTKKGVISYTASAGHIGRNPGPPKPLKKLREWGDLSGIPPMRTLHPATSSNPLGPVYPAPYSNVWHAIGSAGTMTKFLRDEIQAAMGPFGLHVNHLRPDESFNASSIVALDLVSLVLKYGTNKLDKKARSQIDSFIKGLIPSRLVRLHLSLLGPSEREQDATIFQLLHRARNTLTHLCLELNFRDKEALQDYLCSEAAARLVSLELKSGCNLQSHILKALQSTDSSKLPNLRYLCLNKPVTPARLMRALRTRHILNPTANNPAYPPLTIELVNVHEFSDSALAQAQSMQITFVEYDVVRPTGN